MFEAKVKEEQREEEKKKKIEQKMAQIDEKNDKVSNEFGDSESVCSPQNRLNPVFVFIIFDIVPPRAASGRGEGQEEGGH